MASHFGDPKARLKAFAGMKSDTLAIHGGQSPDPTTGSVMPPIYQTSTYAQSKPGVPLGEFEYSRTHNPTRRMLEDALALMESGTYGLVTASGMSAISLVLSLLKQGDEVLCCDDVYGGTYRLFTKMMPSCGLSFKFGDFTNPEKVLELASSATKMVWVETPTNPLLKVMDISAIAKICKAKGWLLVVDNTFATPIFQRPLEQGADLVVHSLTKYINGHSDVVAGAVIGRDDALAQRLYFNQNSAGHVAGPFDSWLVLRGLKTLPVRMRAHQANALELKKWLSEHSKIDRVLYPGFGGMLSFYLKGGLKEAQKLLETVKIFTLAESLGGVESLIEHPGLMTHASLPAEVRSANGIGDNFIRLSVGLEDIDDLKKDMDFALS